MQDGRLFMNPSDVYIVPTFNWNVAKFRDIPTISFKSQNSSNAGTLKMQLLLLFYKNKFVNGVDIYVLPNELIERCVTLCYKEIGNKNLSLLNVKINF